jgi:hypothetical protein
MALPKDNRGQTLLETVLLTPIMVGLIGFGLVALKAVWFGLVVEQVAYECSMCRAVGNNTRTCVQRTRGKLQRFTETKGQAQKVEVFETTGCTVGIGQGDIWTQKHIKISIKAMKRDSRSYFLRL